jgi:hypothetical protein
MDKDRIQKRLTFLAVFIVLFLLSYFSASYRKAVQAAVPVLQPTIARAVSPAPHRDLLRRTPSRRLPGLRPPGRQSMRKVISALSPELRPRLHKMFATNGINYPPAALTLIVLKEEQFIEVWSPDPAGDEKLITSYPILGASGTLGPKLLKGDLQVPEGFYKVLWFNPNSAFYLSMKIDYPNRFDRSMAELDGRTDLGGDIFIHGYDVSLGCVAIGNPAIEELFLLVYDAGKKNTRVIISPYDFRKKLVPAPGLFDAPEWTELLYDQIKQELLLYTGTSSDDKIG